MIILAGGKGAPPPIHGVWGTWRKVGGCSVSCGKGLQRYERVCDSPPPQHGGRPCEGPSIDHDFCDPFVPCPGK